MSRRTETVCKAQTPGKSARHDKAQDSGDRVNAAVAWGKFTFLSGEICLTPWPANIHPQPENGRGSMSFRPGIFIIYTHVLQQGGHGVRSPLDDLNVRYAQAAGMSSNIHKHNRVLFIIDNAVESLRIKSWIFRMDRNISQGFLGCNASAVSSIMRKIQKRDVNGGTSKCPRLAFPGP